MSNQVIVDLFAEDRAHESFLEPLLTRIAREQDQVSKWRYAYVLPEGHSRAIAEFELYQSIVTKSLLSSESADIVVVAIDGNCSTFTEERRRIQDATVPMLRDPTGHSMSGSTHRAVVRRGSSVVRDYVGYRPNVGDKKCARGHYKQVLTTTIRQAGHQVILGGVEFAPELVEGMDLYRAGRNDSSLNAFLRDLRVRLRQVTRDRDEN